MTQHEGRITKECQNQIELAFPIRSVEISEMRVVDLKKCVQSDIHFPGIVIRGDYKQLLLSLHRDHT